jgi:hypothetical protein
MARDVEFKKRPRLPRENSVNLGEEVNLEVRQEKASRKYSRERLEEESESDS